jgi:hypothetical protein
VVVNHVRLKFYTSIFGAIIKSLLAKNGIFSMMNFRHSSTLTDRKQKCQLGDVITSESRVTCGIPQGSILGPLLFLLYINYLPDCLRQVSPRLFADDTNLTAAGEIIEEVELLMNNDLLRIKEWLLANKLSLNVAKK